MATILFPTDFSEAANRAFIYALKLADKMDARIVTLHAFDRPDISSLPHVPRALEEFHRNLDLEEFENYRSVVPALRKIQEDEGLTQVPVVHTIIEGDTKEVILKQAEVEEADLIVMGTTGARGLKKVLLGSVAGEILENAPCPVLAVPREAVFDGEINTIAFTTSFAQEEIRGLNLLQDLFAVFAPSIHIVHVDLAHTASFTQRMDNFARHFAGRENLHFHILEGNDLQAALTEFFDQQGVDIVAMVTHKRNFFEELFQYSKTKAMAYHSHTPILSLPEEAL